jgi:subtilisin family serine protease
MAKRTAGSRLPGHRPRVLLLLLVALAAYKGAPSAAGAAGDTLGKIEPGLLDKIQVSGEITFWVLLHERANLAPAYQLVNHDARGAFVYRRLNEVANRSQAGLHSLLDGHGASYRPFWIVNAVRVTAGEALLLEIAARPEVKSIQSDRTYRLPPVDVGAAAEARVDTVEWGIDRIRAPLVWSTFNDRGEGIVVAHIDTGVQYNHPALVRQYRGNLGGGSFDHNYNWFDPSHVCNPANVPCDNVAHGTHIMGTMVGDDGMPGPNQIGVAPNAKWIAAKGCESNSCSLSALLASGQWVLAPTDLQGNNPRPDLRPHVVNNSWGGGPGDTFYLDTVQAWLASGIFPAFANSGSGPGCGTVGSPGDYTATYSAGAFDINNNIASFSGRGPSTFPGPSTSRSGPFEIKPNIAAPGVSIRSSVPTNSYLNFSGSSMALPHVAGTVALIWSAAPVVSRNVGATRFILDDSAVDVSSLGCGGTADDNNVWGEGRLDAFAAVERAPR